MPNNSDFGPEEIAADTSFQRWKRLGDPDAAVYWQEWVRQQPERQELIDKATTLLISIDQQYGEPTVPSIRLSDEEIRAEIGRLRQSLGARRQSFRRMWAAPVRYGIAASVLALLGFFGWYALRPSATRPAATYAELVAQHPDPLTELINDGSRAMTVALPDRSTVRLYPNSRISYPKAGTGTKREVYLEGKAFFTVVKNPTRPFSVYADNVVTRVLGTSFTVQTNEKSRQVKVIVRTGKVAVYATGQPAAGAAERAVVLTPNQQLVFSTADSRFVRSVVADPVVVNPALPQPSFRFQRTPISEVFAALEQTYGVRIEYDKTRMRNCYLTASLADEPFGDKLDLICRTVNATYQQTDGTIVIHTDGCD